MAATNYGRYLAITGNATYLTITAVDKPKQYRIYGTWVGTVVVQAKRPDQAASDYSTIKSVTTSPDHGIIELDGTWDIRIGTSAYTSGTVEVEIS